MGAEGEQTILGLVEKRLSPGVLRAANVTVTRRKGQRASDLDVVVYSPRENLLVVLEIKWHIGVDGTYEETAIEQSAVEKRDRLRLLRESVQAGTTTVGRPHTWPPVPDSTQWRWFVLTNDVLPTQDSTNERHPDPLIPDAQTPTPHRSDPPTTSRLTRPANTRRLYPLLGTPPLRKPRRRGRQRRLRAGSAAALRASRAREPALPNTPPPRRAKHP